MTNISYELLGSEIEKHKRVNLSYVKDVAEKLTIEIMESQREEIYEFSPQKKLKDIADWIGDCTINYIGSTDDFHNISVAYASLDLYIEACEVLERGLVEKPMNVDLIADMIGYSTKCGIEGMKRSQRFYKRLNTIPKNKWSWRAFSFSIDYLMEKYEMTLNPSKRMQLEAEIMELADEFVCMKNSDRAYYDMSEIYRKFGDLEKEQEILNEAMEKLNSTQQCRFRLADIEFEKGHYQESIDMLKTCLFDFRLQDSINKGVAFLILAMSRASICFEKSKKELLEKDIEEIKEIYNDIKSARSYGLDSFENAANILEKVIEQQTGVKPEGGEEVSSDKDEFDF